MTSAKKIWLTRPREDSESIALALRQHGIQSVIAPVMRIEYATPALGDTKPGALLLTSRYAAAAIPDAWRKIPVYCVGEATAEAARAMGCSRAQAGDGDVLALLPLLARQLKPGTRIVYLSGEEVRLNLGALAASKQLIVERHIAYTAHAEPRMPDSLAEKLYAGEIAAVACFSPRAATIANEWLNGAMLHTHAPTIEMIGMSLAVAQAASALPWKALHACATPTAEAMIELIVSRMDAAML